MNKNESLSRDVHRRSKKSMRHIRNAGSKTVNKIERQFLAYSKFVIFNFNQIKILPYFVTYEILNDIINYCMRAKLSIKMIDSVESHQSCVLNIIYRSS